jgi:hypothetical protein
VTGVTGLAAGVSRPNPALTPGAANPAVTQATIGSTLCVSGWARTQRPPVSVTEPEKLASMRAYGITGPPSSYEFDHLEAIEIAGNNSTGNLWPQPYEQPKGPAAPGTGSETKDRVENATHAAVCSGRMTLAAAQTAMARDWYGLGQQLGVVTGVVGR